MQVTSKCVTLLVRSLECACEPSLAAMTKMHWNMIEEVGDTSPYVSEVGGLLKVSINKD